MMLRFALRLLLGAGLLAAWGEGSAVRAEETAAFHHVHINAVDPASSISYYKRYFSAVPVKYADVSDALLTDRSFILFNRVETPAPSELKTAIWHLGWGGVDGPSDFAWREREGVEFETPLMPLGNLHYMYAYGPDRELVEVWTGFHHHRFGHVHLLADDINATKNWYRAHLGLQGPTQDSPRPPAIPADLTFDPGAGDPSVFRYMWTTQVMTDAVTLNIFGKPGPEKTFWWAHEPIAEFAKTDGRVVDHIAFSYRDLDAAFERMKAEGVEIVEPIADRPEFGLRSFFVRGPDGVLIEIVQSRPLPQGIWEE